MNSRRLIEPLEPRRLFTGVTLITHGFNSGISDWVTAMGDKIATQTGPLASQPMYVMTATDDGSANGPISVVSTRLGPDFAHWGSTEIIVLLDWSQMSGGFSQSSHHRPTGDVAAAVAAKFESTFSIPDLATPLVQLPIHLIGHSRGASLISELAGDLGQQGAWVDQVTYLDPHPVDGINDPFNINYGDAPMRVYDNVQFADDYWRTQGPTSLDFTGEPVSGAYNLQLSESVLSDGGYSLEHSDVHLWYHGTIGPPFSDTDGSATIGAGWYSSPMPARDVTGYHYTLLGRGTREPTGLKSAGAHRDPVTLAATGANVYDNISITNLISDTTIAQGTSIAVSTVFEDRSVGGTRDATLTIGLDRDDNPFNGFATGSSVATSTLAVDSYNTNLSTSSLFGAYRVYAKISNGTTARYFYAPAQVVITATGVDKTWIGPASAGQWSDPTNWSPAAVPTPADKVAIYASDVAVTSDTAVAGLSLAGGASLNLDQNDLAINYTGTSPLPTIHNLLFAGHSTSAGIYSPSALASAGTKSLGYAEASEARGLTGAQTTTFDGFTIDATTVLIKFTYTGDADLNGAVNGDDYFAVDSHVNLPSSTGWIHGDFTFDDHVNGDDYFWIDSVIHSQAAPI